jgi:hypothetical protein
MYLSPGVLLLRAVFMLVMEMITDVWKNSMFWYVFGVLPIRVRTVPQTIDYIQIAVSLGGTCNMYFAGTLIHAMYAT